MLDKLASRWVRTISLTLTLSIIALMMAPQVSRAEHDDSNDATSEIYSVQLSSNGEIKSVSTSSKELDPLDAGERLPVRLVTTYSFGSNSSSNPSLVSGATGRVRIDLAVYNLTGKLEQIAVDVNGEEVRRDAWVSTPISVAAVAVLPGLDVKQIIVPDVSKQQLEDDYTNGVVGQDSNGTARIQWAGLTGLEEDVARFSLVVDAENFQLPTFDILVQPGFGIDPNPEKQREQSELVVSTLKSLEQAGKVLAESGKAIGDARKLLSDAGSQIGNKTINDLNSSNARLSASASQIIATLNTIDAQASSMFSISSSHVSNQLALTTFTIKSLLGDPKSPKPIVKIDPNSCNVSTNENTISSISGKSKPLTEKLSVLDVIYGLSSRLDALASTTKQCQNKLTDDIDMLLGPENPSEEICKYNDGLSCRLLRTERQLADYTDYNLQAGKKIVDRLSKSSENGTLTSIERLEEYLNELSNKIDDLKHFSSENEVNSKLLDIKSSLVNIDQNTDELTDLLDRTAHSAHEIGDASEIQDDKLNRAKQIICISSGLTSSNNNGSFDNGSMGPEIANKLLDLLAETSCPSSDSGIGLSFEGDRTAGGDNSVQGIGKNIRHNVSEISTMVSSSVPGADPARAREAIKNLKSNKKIFEQRLQETIRENSDTSESIAKSIESLTEAQQNLNDSLNELKNQTNGFSEEISNASSDLKNYLDTTHSQTNNIIVVTNNYMLDGIATSRNLIRENSGTIFDSFSSAIVAESNRLTHEGGSAVALINKQVSLSNAELSESTKKLMAVNANSLHKVSDAAVADTNAIALLLSSDIALVISDIGKNATKGSGLLGAMATSESHLGVADIKLADSTTSMTLAQTSQRYSLLDSNIREAKFRSSLARLEQPVILLEDSSPNGNGCISFHLKITRKP